MSTLKNARMKIGFWFYKNSHSLMLVYFFLMVFSLISTLIFTTKNKPAHYTNFDPSVFLYFIPFLIMAGLFLFFLSRANKNLWLNSSNYLIVIDLAEKLCQKICDEGKMTGEISAKLSILTTETRAKKDSKELTVWMINYYAYEKYQKSLEEKRGQLENLQNLSIEISVMERLSKNKF